jgi:Mg/Co/Ni transporter MgtE
MMTTDFVYVGETATRAEVVDWIRGRDIKLEQLDTIFLIDGDAKLSGAVAVARLLLIGADDGLAHLRSDPLVSIAPEANDEELFVICD